MVARVISCSRRRCRIGPRATLNSPSKPILTLHASIESGHSINHLTRSVVGRLAGGIQED